MYQLNALVVGTSNNMYLLALCISYMFKYQSVFRSCMYKLYVLVVCTSSMF